MHCLYCLFRHRGQGVVLKNNSSDKFGLWSKSVHLLCILCPIIVFKCFFFWLLNIKCDQRFLSLLLKLNCGGIRCMQQEWAITLVTQYAVWHCTLNDEPCVKRRFVTRSKFYNLEIAKSFPFKCLIWAAFTLHQGRGFVAINSACLSRVTMRGLGLNSVPYPMSLLIIFWTIWLMKRFWFWFL